MERWVIRIGQMSKIAALILGPIALALIFFYAPLEREQGIIQKIFYIHVPVVIMAYLGFGLTAVAGALYLWFGQRSYDRVAKSAAEVGVVFCTLVLVSGPIWAKPVWGVWWTWEARLTLTLTMWFIYAAYLLLRKLTEGEETAARFSSILGILGVSIIPFVRIAVERFRGNHPGNPFKAGLPMEMQIAFYTTLVFFFFFFLATLGRRTALEQKRDELQALKWDVDE